MKIIRHPTPVWPFVIGPMPHHTTHALGGLLRPLIVLVVIVDEDAIIQKIRLHRRQGSPNTRWHALDLPTAHDVVGRRVDVVSKKPSRSAENIGNR